MEKYKEYMDGVTVSDVLHRRLLELEAPAKRPIPWKKYGSMVAALVLVLGLGAWGLSRGGAWDALAANFQPAANVMPEIADEPEPALDIAIEEPGGEVPPGQKAFGGYEVRGEENGPDTVVAYYLLPYIEYGATSGPTADYSLVPPDGGLRGATRDDALALVGGEDALTAHLNWGACEFRGAVGFEADGTVWMMSLWGEGTDTAFSLELSPNCLPPTCCVVMGEERTITDVWGVEVCGVNNAGAYGNTERGVFMDVSREVEFIANGVGCRLKVYGTQDRAVEELVSRFVRWAILEGLNLSGISPEGAAPLDMDPNYSVGEPNWNDSGADFPAYDPDEAADPAAF